MLDYKLNPVRISLRMLLQNCECCCQEMLDNLDYKTCFKPLAFPILHTL